MGKVKKVAAPEKEEEGQRKISSFFQNPSATSSASKLFTEVGVRSKSSHSHGGGGSHISKEDRNKKKPTDVIVLDDTDDFVDASKANRKSFSSSKLDKALSTAGKVKSKISESSTLYFKHAEPEVIPETQISTTPKGRTLGNSESNRNSLRDKTSGSPVVSERIDFGIIPDTPTNVPEVAKPKLPLGRSFLLSSSAMSTNPIQIAKENRDAKEALKKKRASIARKGLVSVSVKFGMDNKSQSEAKDVNAQSSFGNDTINKPVTVKQGTNSDEVDFISPEAHVKSVSHIELDVTTPTKIYSEGSSMKRMAKPGISPDFKRTTPDLSVDENNAEQVMKQLDFIGDKNTIHIDKANIIEHVTNKDSSETIRENAEYVEEFNRKAMLEIERQERLKREKVERLEKLKQEKVAEKKKLEKEKQRKYHEKLLNYQLSGDSIHSRSGGTNGKGDSVQDDDTLDDLLEELNSPSLIKSSSVNSRYSKREERNKSVKGCVSKHSDFKLGKRRSVESGKQLKKRKSLEGILLDNSVVDKIASFESPMSKPIKRVSLAGKTKTADVVKTSSVSTDWTNDDEEYFAKLGVKMDATCESNCDIAMSNAHDNVLLCLSINGKVENTKKISDQMIVKSQMSSKDDRRVKILPESSIDNKKQTNSSEMKSTLKADSEIDIDIFPTPCFQATERSRSPQEMAIDEFGTQLDSQMLCDEFEHLTPFKNKGGNAPGAGIFQTSAPCSEFGRHTVTDIQTDNCHHKMTLTLATQPGDLVRTCVLHGFWLDSQVTVGDTIHILADFDNDGICHITDQKGLLVINPDILLSGTTVVGSVFCMRRSILKEKFKGCESSNVHMLYGSIIHNIFQQVLRKKLLTETEILAEADRILKERATVLEMYGNSVTEVKVMEEVKSYLPQIIAWTKQYTNIGQDMLGNQRLTQPDVLVTKVSDIEENIWSPRFGIKGKIDLTVEVKMKNEKKKCILPLELKTGKPTFSVEHKGQVTLYSMMCSDRREDPRKGLLLYLREPSMKVIPADYVNQKGLIQLRNEMAYYISRQVKKTSVAGETTFNLGRLPEPISNLRACQKCPQVLNCAVYQRHVEGRSCDQDGMSQLVNETLQHLTPDHVTYFTQWCLMLDLETQTDQTKKTVADIWCRSSQEREDLGQCISGMLLVEDVQPCSAGDDPIIVPFHRHPDNQRSGPLSSIGLNVQDSIVVSCERPAWVAVCTGFVHHISRTEIQLLIDSDAITRLSGLKEQTFRLDKCDNFSTAGIFYTNVSRLMADDQHCHSLRRLIIDKIRPEFQNTLSKGNIEKVKKILKSLNKPQKTAILKALMVKQYVLIKGYPGTGKTSTIVALVKVLHTLGLSVLLTSYTHSAVDNILQKLIKDGMKFLRLGRLAKIHPAVREYSVDVLTRGITSPNELEHFLHSQMIVATSCLGTNHAMFSHRQFDVCIVDEASQVVQAACLGPLFSSRKFILVGDPKQLPPVVQSFEARNLGMDESLFVRLDGLGATFALNLQYRMNSEIMSLSNQLVYDGCLKCGSDDVANRVLHLPHREHLANDERPWMADVGDCSLQKAVVFLDTHKIPAPEMTGKGGVVKNVVEAKLVHDIVAYLLQAGVPASDIGIIAPYRSQVFLLRNMLSEGQGHTVTSGVEVNTVDQYQGRDKEVILISFVRSSVDKDLKTGELLKDMRRLNVAITRAKSKLILVGDGTTLTRYKPLEQLLKIVRDKNQIITLPNGAVG